MSALENINTSIVHVWLQKDVRMLQDMTLSVHAYVLYKKVEVVTSNNLQ